MALPVAPWRMSRAKVPHGHAFTLIEVLVVVAIMALLVSILLPSLKKARDQAKIAACLANLHDFSTSLFLYAADTGGRYFPPTPYMGSAGPGCPPCDDNLFVLWYRKYTKDVRTYSCPATRYRVRVPEQVDVVLDSGHLRYDIWTEGFLRSDFREIAQVQTGLHKDFGTSYEYNAWSRRTGSSARVTWFPNAEGVNLQDWFLHTPTTVRPQPAFKVLMHEADDVIPSIPGSINNYPEPWDNHGTFGMNILFADGHSRMVRRWDLGDGGDPLWGPGSGGRTWKRMEVPD